MANPERVKWLIDRHPLNGQYGFTRNECIEQLREQARLADLTAANSQRSGRRKTMVEPEVLIMLANFALAALDGESDDLEPSS